MSFLLALLTGCIVDQPLPQLGDCAEYPEGTYEYGQIGIGTCLAGPSAIHFVDNDGDPVLLVSNSNHLLSFTGGSLLSIPWASVDLASGRNIVSDLSPAAVDQPSFAGGFGVWDQDSDGHGDLAIVSNRLSEDARTRAWPDEVRLVDITDARSPAEADLGTDGGPTVGVGADPTEVVVDPVTGMAYVVNRTSHSVSILDLTGDQVEVVVPWPEQALGGASLDDVDGSRSTAELSTLSVVDGTLVPDERWELTWVDGTWRVWVPTADGLVRSTSAGDHVWTESSLGVELAPDDAAIAIEAIHDPAVLMGEKALTMYFEDGGSVLVAWSEVALVEWTVLSTEALSAREDGWDAIVSAPSVVYGPEDIAMFYGGTDASQTRTKAIGRAGSSDGQIFSRLGEAVIEPTWDHELGGIDDPEVIYDGEIGLWRMYYSAFDGARWTIGHATSADLDTWVSDDAPVYTVDGVDIAAPAVSYEPGNYRMWYARNEGTGWVVAEASSPDGYSWTEEAIVSTLLEDPGDPPGPTVQAAVDRHFRLERGSTGELVGALSGGSTVVLEDQGIELGVVAGYWLGTQDAGAASAGGITVDSVDPATGACWLTLTDEGGTPAIASGGLDGAGQPRVDGVVLSAQEHYEDRGISHPTVVPTADGYVMLYAAHRRSTVAIARASSPDGITWTRDGLVLEPGAEWDSLEIVPGSLQVEEDGTWRLFYSGTDGDTWRIGEATSGDQGRSWNRDSSSRGYTFTTGTPGEWDDSGVRDPAVKVDADGVWHMWYAGFDGDVWRLGYARRDSADQDWVRFEDAYSQEKRPVVSASDGLFHPQGLLRPVVLSPEEADPFGGDGQSWLVWYAGRNQEIDRVGRAWGRAPDALHRDYRRPTPGDRLSFESQRGDEDQLWIPLDAEVEGANVTAPSVASATLDSERGFLYVVGKERPYIFVIDVRDDSPLPDGSADLNYLDIEAVIAARNAGGADGFRQVLPVPGVDRLYALNDDPDAVWIVDIGDLEDDAWGTILYDDVIGSISAPRGIQRDEGVSTQADTGIGQMVLHPDGHRLFVSNTNANSIGVIDLDLGPYGTWTDEVTLVGENPFAMALSPDARHLVFANMAGEVTAQGVSQSTLGVLDVDPTSPTYLEVLTWIANR